MHPGRILKADRLHRIPLSVRWLVALFTCLLIIGTALIFSGLATFAATPWTITPSSTLTAGDVNCPVNADGSWTCSIMLGDPSAPGPGVNWSTRTTTKSGFKGGGRLSGVTFTPSSGILSGGETTPISIHIPRTAAACQNGTFVFINSFNGRVLAQATWTCKYVPVVMTVSPTTLSPFQGDTNCMQREGSITCTVTLADPAYSTDGFNWKATSNFGATITPPFGTLSPNESTPVTITFTSSCSSTPGTVTFTAKSLRPFSKAGKTPPSPPPVTVTVDLSCNT